MKRSSLALLTSLFFAPVAGYAQSVARVKQIATPRTMIETEVHALLQGWREAFGDALPADMNKNEKAAKIDLSPSILRHWFGEAMLTEPVRIADLQRASVVDLLRLLDYPSEFVPVVTRRQRASAAAAPSVEQIDVLDKTALNARLARSYLVELMDRARIS